jgi:hypothetical protein
MFKRYLFLFSFILLSSCNTVTGSIEGTALGIVKDIKTTYHYTTCVFTEEQCGDLDLD